MEHVRTGNLRRAGRRRLRRLVQAGRHRGRGRVARPSSRRAGAALELGIGTGPRRDSARGERRRGARHRGVRRRWSSGCAAKPGGEAIPVTIGDMAEVPVDGEFALVFVVFNTFFQLYSQDAQVRCFANVAAASAAGRALPRPRVRARHVAGRSGSARFGEGGVARSGAARRERVRRATNNGSTPRRSASPKPASGSCTPSCGSRGRPSSTSWRGSPGLTLENRWSTFDKQAVHRRERLPRLRLSRMI